MTLVLLLVMFAAVEQPIPYSHKQHLALGLKLIDGLSVASPDSGGARGEMEKALLAGHIARQVASTATMYDTEEAVGCSMLHSLGRMMVSFYLPELWQSIQTRLLEGEGEDVAVPAVLGLGFDAVGRLVAQQWGLPSGLVDTLHDVVPETAQEPLDHADWLAAVSTLSTRCADVIYSETVSDTDLHSQITHLTEGYASMLGVDPAQLAGAVDVARQTAETDSGLQRNRRAQWVSGSAPVLDLELAEGPLDARRVTGPCYIPRVRAACQEGRP